MSISYFEAFLLMLTSVGIVASIIYVGYRVLKSMMKKAN